MKRTTFTEQLGWPIETRRESVSPVDWANPVSRTSEVGHSVVSWLSAIGLVVVIGLLFAGML